MSEKLSALTSLPSSITTGDLLYVVRNGVSYKALESDLPSGGVVETVVGGTDITVDATDPANPIVNFTGAGGSGTVTSVAVSGSDGLEVDSGSPVTTSGTIALGVNKATLLAHLGITDDYHLSFAFGGEDDALVVGTGAITFQMPNFATTLTGVSVNVKTAPTGSAANTPSATFDLNEGGTSVLSTKITIDAGEKTSETAATPPVISDSAIAANAIMTLDIDGIGSTVAGAGGKAWIYYTRA